MDGSEIQKCPLCRQEISETCDSSKLTAKGVASLLEASKQRKDDSLVVSINQLIHNKSRAKYVHKREIKKFLDNEIGDVQPQMCGSVRRRSTESPFCFKTNCFLCKATCDSSDKRNSAATTLELKSTVLTTCDQRSDKWGDDVRARLQSINDLPAADAIYHRQCFRNFKSHRSIPKNYASEPDSKKVKVGRQVDEDTTCAFFQICDYLEDNYDEQITAKNLIDKKKRPIIIGTIY